MTTEQRLVATVLEMVGDRAEADALADVGTSSLTRFANSFIHQNVSEDTASVTLRVAVDGKVSSSTTTITTDDALRAFVDATIETASQQPVDDEWPGFGGPVAYPLVDHWDQATAVADPMARAEAVKAFVDAGDGLLAAGYCQTEAKGGAYGNTAGRNTHGRYTSAIVDGIHQTSGSAGSGHGAGSALGALDASAIGRLAAQRARDSVDPFDTKPGDYEVILSPEAVATIAIFLDVYGFNAKMSQEGMSFVDLEAAQFDPSFDLWDDATDPRAIGMGFDGEGTPKGRTDLVKAGVTTSLLHSRRTAKKGGASSTGHAAPGAEMWGPIGWNLFVGEGNRSVEQLVSEVERGIYVSTFNYCRVLEPKAVSVTGLTRNGTFMIENGRITDPVSNLRFTQSFLDALGPEKVLGIGNDGRFADSEFGPSMVHAPTLHLASWNFTGGAEG